MAVAAFLALLKSYVVGQRPSVYHASPVSQIRIICKSSSGETHFIMEDRVPVSSFSSGREGPWGHCDVQNASLLLRCAKAVIPEPLRKTELPKTPYKYAANQGAPGKSEQKVTLFGFEVWTGVNYTATWLRGNRSGQRVADAELPLFFLHWVRQSTIG